MRPVFLYLLTLAMVNISNTKKYLAEIEDELPKGELISDNQRKVITVLILLHFHLVLSFLVINTTLQSVDSYTHISPIHRSPFSHKNYSWGKKLVNAEYIMTYDECVK